MQLFKYLRASAVLLGLAAALLLSGATAVQAFTEPQPSLNTGYNLDELQESDYNHLLFEPEDVDDEDEDDGKRKRVNPWVVGGVGAGVLGTIYIIYKWMNRGRKAVKYGNKVRKRFGRRRSGDTDGGESRDSYPSDYGDGGSGGGSSND